MSGDWLPVVVVLAVGALVGVVLVWRFARGGGSGSAAADEALRLEDLEQRRDDLYRRLDETESEADRRVLEDQAARVLRDIDRLGGSAAPRGGAAAARATPATPPSASRGRPMLIGFVGGTAMAALVGLLVYFALRDAQPDAVQPRPMAPAGEEHPVAALAPETEARLEALREQVAAQPNDIIARKQLALALLSAEQFFEAFQTANSILAQSPGDPDGLYVAGMVRMAMGQDEEALAALNEVVAQFPNHILAQAGRGMIFLRQGDREAAALVFERALQAAGGSNADLEQLLAMAREESMPTPPAEAATAPAPTAPTPAAPDPTASEPPAAADEFGVVIELAPGISVPRGATLFVFLRQGEQGPPAAVKRIQEPSFPLQVTLGPSDSMLGRPLPSAGVISVRLDADGSVSTRDASDLEASGQGKVGERIRVQLGG